MRVGNMALLVASITLGFAMGYALQGKQEQTKSLSFMKELYDDVLKTIQRYYVEEEDPALLVEESIKGMVKVLDPYSEFLTPEDFKRLNEASSGRYGGVGMEVREQDGKIIVVSTFEGAPAQKAGLMPGDIIIKVDDEDITSLELEEVVEKIKGKPGTKVKLTIFRPGLDELLDFEITREIIKVPIVPYYTMLEGNIGYVRFAQFTTASSQELEDRIKELKEKGATKFIIDLRGNPGGYLFEAIKTADIFLEEDALIVFTRGREQGSTEYFKATSKPLLEYDVPLIVLVNNASASASEIVAGALQDWDRAIIIGDTTFGKGSVQRLIPLEGGYALKLTTSRYYTPSGRSIDRTTKTLKERRSKKKEEHLLFFTKKLHRKVYGGGGIVPDIVIEPEREPSVVSKLIAKGVFGAFASSYKSKHESYNFHEGLFDEFLAFVQNHRKFSKDFNVDEIKLYRDNVLKFIDIYLSEIYKGSKGRYEAMLKYDEVVLKAKELLMQVNTTDELFQKVMER